MALNIKDDEIHRMAKELATLRGESMTDAVRDALSHELERTKKQEREDKEAMVEKLLEIARRCAAAPDAPDAPPIEPGKPASDHSWLYDENGLPK